MKKKRKLNIIRLIVLIVVFLIIVVLAVFVINKLSNKKEHIFNVDDYVNHSLDYRDAKQLDLDLYSDKYMLVRLSDFKVLYAKNEKDKFYPASLTKVLTLDTVLSNTNDLNDTSSFSTDEYNALIEENASLAGLDINKEYTIEELLYALVLPSGADAAKCLENYFYNKGLNLTDLMNAKCKDLNLKNSHFVNTTGLHDDYLYTSLDDYANIVIDTLKNDVAKKVLKTNEKEVAGVTYDSTLKALSIRDDDVHVYGGKTGFTYEAGLNILVLYEVDNRPYMLILANAKTEKLASMLNIIDANIIFDYLYN